MNECECVLSDILKKVVTLSRDENEKRKKKMLHYNKINNTLQNTHMVM